MIYFTSDIHFGHKNVISYNARPFDCPNEMDEAIIEKWNKKVHRNDTVYIVGDVTLGKNVEQYVSRLKGRKILVAGNHDLFLKKEENKALFDSVTKLLEIRLDNKRVTLCHYPMIEWAGSRRDPSDKNYGYLIYGHIHNTVKPIYRSLLEADNAFNAGMDVNGFVPVSWDELVQNNRIFRKKALEKPSDSPQFLVRFTDMTLASTPFDQIASGEKTIEMRLFDEKRQKLQVGDVLRFTRKNSTDLLFAEITSLQPFPSFKDAFSSPERTRQAGFGSLSPDAAALEMRSYYSQEQETRFGTLAIGIRLFR